MFRRVYYTAALGAKSSVKGGNRSVRSYSSLENHLGTSTHTRYTPTNPSNMGNGNGENAPFPAHRGSKRLYSSTAHARFRGSDQQIEEYERKIKLLEDANVKLAIDNGDQDSDCEATLKLRSPSRRLKDLMQVST